MASLLDKVKKPNQPIDEEKFIQFPEHKGKKLLVKVWSSDSVNPHVIAKKKIPYGQPYCNIRFAGKDHRYKINYQTEGMIKQEDKEFIYDTHFSNTVGGLAFHEYPEEMDSSEVYDTHINNGVDLYVKKGGIRPILLYICIGIIGVSMIGIMYFAQYALGLQANQDIQQKNLVSLSTKVDQLREQIKNLGATPKV